MALVVIQNAALADASEIRHFFRLEEEHHAAMYPDYFVSLATDVPLAFIEEEIRNTDSVLLVAKDRGRSVGFLHGKVKIFSEEPQFKEIAYLMIEDCYVDRDYRKRGIASQLMEEAKTWALRRGIRRVQLQVWARNQDAVRLYRSLGFEDLISRMELKLQPR